jgi:unspecific monooxygenase
MNGLGSGGAVAIAAGFDPTKFNPHDPAFLADPFPTYAAFREHAPIFQVPLYQSDWMFRYAECKQMLEQTDVWIKAPPSGLPPGYGPYGFMQANFPPGLFSSDPPLHTELHALLEPPLRGAIPRAPDLAREFGAPLLAAARAHGRIELVSDYALPLPSSVLFALLGIPNDPVQNPGLWPSLVMWTQMIAAAHDITQAAAVRGAGATSSMALNSFFEAMLLADQRSGSSGLFADICAAFAAAGRSPQEVQMCAIDFLVAGYLSTTFIIATGTYRLLRNPDQLAALRADSSLIAGALEEMLRYDGPVQVIDRFAKVDTMLAGKHYPQNSKVTAVVGSADHDASVYPDPELFEVTRRPGVPHLGFGAGIHYCIGAPLVRLVAPVAFELLLGAFPNLALDGIPQWQTDPYLRAVTSLPLRF